MSFSNYLRGNTHQKIDEAISPELKAEYKALAKKIDAVAEEIKNKLTKTPVKYNSSTHNITIGLDSFEIKNLPSFSVYKDRFDDKIVIKQGSNDFTPESALKYAEMLEEVSKNADFLEDALTRYEKLKYEFHDLNTKAIKQNSKE